MIYLLDVNVLIALFDEFHVHHALAHRWFAARGQRSWATCPVTELAFLRIVGSPSYPRPAGSLASAREHLTERADSPGHKFWPDDLSLVRGVDLMRWQLLSASQLTDCYLLALAAKHGGKLATFDKRIPADVVSNGAASLHLVQ